MEPGTLSTRDSREQRESTMFDEHFLSVTSVSFFVYGYSTSFSESDSIQELCIWRHEYARNNLLQCFSDCESREKT